MSSRENPSDSGLRLQLLPHGNEGGPASHRAVAMVCKMAQRAAWPEAKDSSECPLPVTPGALGPGGHMVLRVLMFKSKSF